MFKISLTNNRWNLSKITSKQHYLATKQRIFLHYVSQNSINNLKSMPLSHWCFIQYNQGYSLYHFSMITSNLYIKCRPTIGIYWYFELWIKFSFSIELEEPLFAQILVKKYFFSKSWLLLVKSLYLKTFHKNGFIGLRSS